MSPIWASAWALRCQAINNKLVRNLTVAEAQLRVRNGNDTITSRTEFVGVRLPLSSIRTDESGPRKVPVVRDENSSSLGRLFIHSMSPRFPGSCVLDFFPATLEVRMGCVTASADDTRRVPSPWGVLFPPFGPYSRRPCPEDTDADDNGPPRATELGQTSLASDFILLFLTAGGQSQGDCGLWVAVVRCALRSSESFRREGFPGQKLEECRSRTSSALTGCAACAMGTKMYNTFLVRSSNNIHGGDNFDPNASMGKLGSQQEMQLGFQIPVVRQNSIFCIRITPESWTVASTLLLLLLGLGVDNESLNESRLTNRDPEREWGSGRDCIDTGR
ncbi:hypothetical protein FB45DRAFT_874755 [Roridomyces roridus]|uniref:Uncharacterized protein n=1 Tax=Roridomyces roridus TaxID=1738132 RepID=A0AAD7FB33_9AGAR|nr:hypothetical protein FB45DRAFT_874755 [Roridomyces roridus]